MPTLPTRPTLFPPSTKASLAESKTHYSAYTRRLRLVRYVALCSAWCMYHVVGICLCFGCFLALWLQLHVVPCSTVLSMYTMKYHYSEAPPPAPAGPSCDVATNSKLELQVTICHSTVPKSWLFFCLQHFDAILGNNSMVSKKHPLNQFLLYRK